MGTHFCHVSLQSGFCHTCLFHSRLEKSWRVFTDKSAFFMQFTGHHCNLLVTKPVPRFPVQHPIPVCNHSTLMTSSCNHSPDNFSAKVFAFNLKATGGRYWRLEKDFSLLDIDGKTFLQPDLCKHFDWWVYGFKPTTAASVKSDRHILSFKIEHLTRSCVNFQRIWCKIVYVYTEPKQPHICTGPFSSSEARYLFPASPLR